MPVQATAWQQATGTGWYDLDPIAQAAANGQQDVTGYRFVTGPSFDLSPVTAGGSFGQLVSLLISNTPAVTFSTTSASNAAAADCADATDASTSAAISQFFDSLSLLNLEPATGTDLFALPDGSTPTVPQLQQSGYVIGATLSTVLTS